MTANSKTTKQKFKTQAESNSPSSSGNYKEKVLEQTVTDFFMGSRPIKEKKDKQGEIIYLLISEFLISLKN